MRQSWWERRLRVRVATPARPDRDGRPEHSCGRRGLDDRAARGVLPKMEGWRVTGFYRRRQGWKRETDNDFGGEVDHGVLDGQSWPLHSGQA